MQTPPDDSIYYHAMMSALSLESSSLDQDPPYLFGDRSLSTHSSTMFMKRPSLSKAERRAEHNAVERARRENLNSKFQQLADSLPNLRSYRRPSKGQIVEKALDWIRQSMHKESRYRHQIYQLQRQNKQLLAQLDQPQDRQLSPPLVVDSTQSSTPTQQHHLQAIANQHLYYPIMNAPQQSTPPYSNDASTLIGLDEKDDDGKILADRQSLSGMLPSATLSPGMYFYNGLPITISASSASSSSSASSMQSSLSSTMDASSWIQINTLSMPTLTPPTVLPF